MIQVLIARNVLQRSFRKLAGTRSAFQRESMTVTVNGGSTMPVADAQQIVSTCPLSIRPTAPCLKSRTINSASFYEADVIL